MKLLIAGKNSYIGCHIGEFVRTKEPDSDVRYISVREDDWKTCDLSAFDAVVFAAAIVHRKDITDETLYHQVNAQLPYEFARKAKAQGVKRFLFLSTAGVYDSDKTLPNTMIISAADRMRLALINLNSDMVKKNPDYVVRITGSDAYGKSKLEGEKLLGTLADEDFLVSIVRPMNVYGKDCPGNYIPMFKKLTRLTPVLPKAFLDVKQGMVHVEHVAKLCYLALKADHGGVYHAQDDEPVSSYEIMQALAKGMGKKRLSLPCHGLMKLFSKVGPVIKLFGGVAYAKELAVCPLGSYTDADTRKLLEEV